MVPVQPACAAAQAEGHSVTVTAGGEAQETKGKKTNSLGSTASVCSFQASGHHPLCSTPPRSDLLMIYWIQPLILKSLMFSWPVSALSTHQFFFPLFQSQPSIKSPEPGEEPPCHGKSFSTSPLCTN